MARFGDILKGKRARRTVEFPLVNTRCSLLPPLAELEAQRAADQAGKPSADDATEPGSIAPEAAAELMLVDLVVLTGAEEAKSLESARAFAAARGVADPRPDEPIYDLGIMVHTLLIGCVDNASPVDAPRPFFDSADQILQNMDRDRITYLYALHEHWQDECSPQTRNLSDDAFFGWLVALAGSESPSDPLERLAPGTRWSYTRTLARLWLSLHQGKSPDGSTSASSTPLSTPANPAASEA